jgi:prepilin-type N-terminal cleavage/methylation domain-containing protein
MKIFTYYQFENTQSGATNPRAFTLVETLVAISVLLIAIVGPFYAISRAINAAYISRDQVTAAALAQEGIEYVYAIRDGNYLANRQLGASYNWLAGLDSTYNGTNTALCFTPNQCTVDPLANQVSECTGACSPLTISPANTYSQNTTYPITRFARSVELRPISANEFEVVSTVTWTTLGNPYSVIIKDTLYNWL